jgi:GNAT superfamily N-acetyltransferase
MITFACEKLETVLPEIKELLQSHYEELTLNKGRVTLKPVWERYFSMEAAGKFYALIARNDGKAVGYSGFILEEHLHYEDILVASNDVLFLHKDFRLGTLGIKLLKYSEEYMKTLGADKVTWHVKMSNDFRPILYRMGYTDEDVIVGKFL